LDDLTPRSVMVWSQRRPIVLSILHDSHTAKSRFFLARITNDALACSKR